ncbi:probable glutathione S-transferase GSTU6 [Lolium rigidum]|uniref:probable glutathione S-transferase GSTU6 n=1 Tax=Lolium rigidum TaxID=89674 RepID=UPI001F5DF92F|nr:probable glutathione S-transferase GSTU6 [Lolium rigidum]
MAGEGDLKLLGGDASQFVARVRMALNMKGMRSYEYIEQDLFNKSSLLLQSNPVHKKVPVLIHNGQPISESLPIVEYVDEVWNTAGAPILPADPYQRAVARFWAAYTDDKLLRAYIGVNIAATEEERAEKVNDTVAAISQLEAVLADGGKAFFAGDSVGYLDIVVGCHLSWLEAFSKMYGVVLLDAAKSPIFAAWAARFGETEAVKGVVPETDTVAEYAKKRRAEALAVKRKN